MRRFRFVDRFNGYSPTLDLNDEAGWCLSRGFDLGVSSLESGWLQQTGYDGAELVTSRRPPVEMTLPLLLCPEPGTGSGPRVEELKLALGEELDRRQNCIEMLPDNLTQPYYIFTYRADIPSILQGLDMPSPFKLGGSPPIVLTIFREPKLGPNGVIL